MYKYLNPKQEALLSTPNTVKEAELILRTEFSAIMHWKIEAKFGQKSACIMCGFYLGRAAVVFQLFPELEQMMKAEIQSINELLNEIVSG